VQAVREFTERVPVREITVSESSEKRIQELEAELSAAREEVERLRTELAGAKREAALLEGRVSTVRDEATKRVLEERSRRV
jgi:wobble nucleotide-excising tRNase